MNNEIWKPIKGYEGKYEVSSIGRVKSLEKIETYYDDQEWIKTKNGGGIGLFTQAGSKFLLNKLNEVIDYVKEIEKL